MDYLYKSFRKKSAARTSIWSEYMCVFWLSLALECVYVGINSGGIDFLSAFIRVFE